MAEPARTSTTTTTSRRRRPLQTCAASMSGIIDTAYEKTGSLGNFTKHLTRFATSTIPFASTMQNLGQTMISLTDDHILFLERVTETVFPPAGRVFDKIDDLVYSVIQDLPDSLKKTEFSPEEEAQEVFMLITQSPDIATESKSVDEDLSGQSSMVTSDKFAEYLAEQEKIDEIQGKSMELYSHKFAESTELDEDLGQVSGNEFVESEDNKNLEAAPCQSRVSDHQEDEPRLSHTQSLVGSQYEYITPSSVADDGDLFLDDEPPLSHAQSFVGVQYEYITSSSVADGGDSFLDDEAFEHVELPMISTSDEDENKDSFVSVSKPPVGIFSDHSHVGGTIASTSSSNKKARKKKAIGKDEHKILELLEAKWHMM